MIKKLIRWLLKNEISYLVELEKEIKKLAMENKELKKDIKNLQWRISIFEIYGG